MRQFESASEGFLMRGQCYSWKNTEEWLGGRNVGELEKKRGDT